MTTSPTPLGAAGQASMSETDPIMDIKKTHRTISELAPTSNRLEAPAKTFLPTYIALTLMPSRVRAALFAWWKVGCGARHGRWVWWSCAQGVLRTQPLRSGARCHRAARR